MRDLPHDVPRDAATAILRTAPVLRALLDARQTELGKEAVTLLLPDCDPTTVPPLLDKLREETRSIAYTRDFLDSAGRSAAGLVSATP